MSATSERVARLLALVPYLQRHQDAPLADVAAAFDVTEDQLVKDFELVFLCGLPGYGPAELIEVHWEGGRVRLEQNADLERPLRLTRSEALALVVGLRLLAETPGLTERDAVDRALAKVETAAGDAAAPASRVVVAGAGEDPALHATATAVAQAVDAGRALHLVYATASRDEVTERTVDPLRVLVVDGHQYLEAWCRRAEGVRLFRLDRVLDLRVLDEPASPPPSAAGRDLDAGLYVPSPSDEEVVLALAPPARWVAEQYPCEVVRDELGGSLVVRLRTAERRWLLGLLLGLGDAAEVVAPADLRAEVAAAARSALERYGASP